MIIVDDSEKCRHGLQFVVWRFAVQQLNHSTAETPYIRRCRSAREFNDLGSHPVWRANNTRFMQACSFCCDTKIGKFNKAFLSRQNVRTFDVTVYDTLLMEIKKSMQYLGHVECNKILWKFAKVLADAVKRAILAVSV